MRDPSARPDLTLSGRVLLRLLDKDRKLDLLWVAAFAAWPLVHSWLVKANDTAGDFAGYWDRLNWTLLPLILPAAVHGLRLLADRVAPISAPWPPPRLPAAIGLIESEPGRERAYAQLREVLLSKFTLVPALVLAALAQVMDMSSLIGVYVASAGAEGKQGLSAILDGTVPKDWSAMFARARLEPGTEPAISFGANASLVVTAYAVQLATIFVGFMVVCFLLRHNWFFLSRVYQRRRVEPGDEAAWIHVRLDDEDRCFGFRPANDAFNVQVWVLALGAMVMLATRFANMGETQGWKHFSSPGQWLVLVGWLAGLAMVTLPSVVKLLPRLPFLGGAAENGHTIQGYLREFLSDEAWTRDEKPPREEVEAVAGLFAQNSFWPSGNNRAGQLFFFSFWVFFIALLPDIRTFEFLRSQRGPEGEWVRYAGWLLGAPFGWGATALVFWFLRWRLSFVDERLANPPAHEIAGSEALLRRNSKLSLDVFISYRRVDSAAYAGRLRDALEELFDPERLFMDVDSIEAGADFSTRIGACLEKAHVVLLLIGPAWLDVRDEKGQRRLDDPEDWVHKEVALALEREIRVVPLLVGGAAMPIRDELPEAIAAVAHRNALELSDTRWDFDVGRVIEALGRVAREPATGGGSAGTQPNGEQA